MTDLISPTNEILFRTHELRCKGSGGLKLASYFPEKLIELRLKFNRKMQVLSCCRSKAYNQRIGGTPKSFHIYDDSPWDIDGSCAIDIKTPSQSYKEALFKLAKDLAWSIGIYSNFLHLDRRIDYLKTQPIVFYGK